MHERHRPTALQPPNQTLVSVSQLNQRKSSAPNHDNGDLSFDETSEEEDTRTPARIDSASTKHSKVHNQFLGMIKHKKKKDDKKNLLRSLSMSNKEK